MTVSGVLLTVPTVRIAVIPTFYNCQYDGKAITLANGMTVPKKCFWTARAAIATTVPLFPVGVMQLLSRQCETSRLIVVRAIAMRRRDRLSRISTAHSAPEGRGGCDL